MMTFETGANRQISAGGDSWWKHGFCLTHQASASIRWWFFWDLQDWTGICCVAVFFCLRLGWYHGMLKKHHQITTIWEKDFGTLFPCASFLSKSRVPPIQNMFYHGNLRILLDPPFPFLYRCLIHMHIYAWWFHIWQTVSAYIPHTYIHVSVRTLIRAHMCGMI